MTAEKDTAREELHLATEVLVLGGGWAGVKTAAEIAALGHPVHMVSQTDGIGDGDEPGLRRRLTASEQQQLDGLAQQLAADAGVTLHTNTRLVGLDGFAGDFNVHLSREGERFDQKVGAVVIATETQAQPLDGPYGVSLGQQVCSLSQMERLLNDEPEQLAGKSVAFLVGLAQDGHPLLMERVLNAVAAATETEGCQVYVYAGDLKVAAEGLERLYRETRSQGAVYIKLNQPPQLEADGRRIVYTDPVLRRQIELEPDLVVVEERVVPARTGETLAADLGLCSEAGGFLQKDNVHFLPVRTNREGIFVVGGARDVQNLSWSYIDAHNAALAVKKLLGDGRRWVPTDRAVVDPQKCVICLTCYRCCPHGAIYYEDNRAVVSPLACQACGICASECPQNAIQMGEFTDTAMAEALRAAGSADMPAGAPRIVAFCCQNSAAEAAEMAEAFGQELPAGLRIIRVPCAGKIDLDYILNAFVEGADGVMVMTCHVGNCKSETGNIYAGWRVEEAQRMMAEAGFARERLRRVTLASNMGLEFARAAREMEATLKELEDSPAKKSA